MAAASFAQNLAKEYSALSKQLQAAADFVMANQMDVASRSLRSLSQSSGLAPATFSRLSRALGYASYEALRESLRDVVTRQVESFSAKAGILQSEAGCGNTPPFIHRQSEACADNIATFARQVEPEKLKTVTDRLHNARRVCLLGALGSAGIVAYMAYLANFFTEGWTLAGQGDGAPGQDLAMLGRGDVLIVLTKPPFARRSVLGAEVAAARGAHVVVITDTHTCPALAHADTTFIVPTDSPQFFSSYATTLVLVETIIGMLVSRAGPDAQTRISDVGNANHHLGELWDA